MDKQATIEDVAHAAGVAIGTVSRYLNGFTIRASNQEKIEKAIKDLSYSTNIAARSMKTNKTYTIGVILTGFDGFSASVLAGLTEEFKKSGYAVVTIHHDDNPDILNDAFKFYSSRQVDGIIFAGGADIESPSSAISSYNKPVVLYNNDIKDLEIDKVLVNDIESSRKAVEYLLQLGHRRIGIVTGALNTSTARNRFKGYKDAFTSIGLEPREKDIYEGTWYSSDGYTGVHNLMDQENPPTAIFFCNYRLAMGGIEALQERKVKMPEEVALITFDDKNMFRLLTPSLTAIAQPTLQISETLTKLMLTRLSGEYTGPPRKITLPCSLIIRDSVTPRTTEE